MALFDSVIGDSSWSETKTLALNHENGGITYHTFTESTSVPAVRQIELKNGITETQTWKTPPSDKSSFTAIKKSGAVKMTEYDVGKKVTEHFVVALPRTAERYTGRGCYSLKTNNTLFSKQSYVFSHTSNYSLQADYDLLREMYPAAPFYEQEPESISALDAEINAVMGRVVSDLSSSYDLMTEVVEYRQTLDLVNTLLKSAISPTRAIRKSIASGKIRAIGDWWLKYRYGIMPIVYSIQDIVKTLEERNAIYRTVHASGRYKISPEILNPTETCFFSTLCYDATIRGTGKERIEGSSLTRLEHRVKTNPFTTAWELVPFSFVVDWFVNVNDWITAQSSILSDLGTDRHYCYSLKVQKVKDVYFHDNHDDRRTLVTGPWTTQYGTIFPRYERSGGNDARRTYLVLTESEDTYARRLFAPTQVNLSFLPYLNWKRWADSFALTSSRTRDLLKRK